MTRIYYLISRNYKKLLNIEESMCILDVLFGWIYALYTSSFVQNLRAFGQITNYSALLLSAIIWVEPRLDPASGTSTDVVSNIVRSNIHGPLHPEQFEFGFWL